MSNIIFEIHYYLNESRYMDIVKKILEKERYEIDKLFDLDTEGGIASTFLLLLNDLTEHAYIGVNEVPAHDRSRVDLFLIIPSILLRYKKSQTLVYQIERDHIIRLSNRGLILIEIKRFKRLIEGLKHGRTRGKIIRQLIDRTIKAGSISSIYLLSAYYGSEKGTAINVMKQYFELIRNEITIRSKKKKDSSHEIDVLRYGVIMLQSNFQFALKNSVLRAYIIYDEINREYQASIIPKYDIGLVNHLIYVASKIDSPILIVKPGKRNNVPGYIFNSERPSQYIQTNMYVAKFS